MTLTLLISTLLFFYWCIVGLSTLFILIIIKKHETKRSLSLDPRRCYFFMAFFKLYLVHRNCCINSFVSELRVFLIVKRKLTFLIVKRKTPWSSPHMGIKWKKIWNSLNIFGGKPLIIWKFLKNDWFNNCLCLWKLFFLLLLQYIHIFLLSWWHWHLAFFCYVFIVVVGQIMVLLKIPVC